MVVAEVRGRGGRTKHTNDANNNQYYLCHMWQRSWALGRFTKF
jgi:hypothetical protein